MDLQLDEPVDGSVVIHVAGDMDANTAYDVYLAAVEQAELGRNTIVLDLADVGFIDSVGLGMLVRSRDDVRAAGSRLQLRNPHPRVRRMLQITALTEAFDITG